MENKSSSKKESKWKKKKKTSPILLNISQGKSLKEPEAWHHKEERQSILSQKRIVLNVLVLKNSSILIQPSTAWNNTYTTKPYHHTIFLPPETKVINMKSDTITWNPRIPTIINNLHHISSQVGNLKISYCDAHQFVATT